MHAPCVNVYFNLVLKLKTKKDTKQFYFSFDKVKHHFAQLGFKKNLNFVISSWCLFFEENIHSYWSLWIFENKNFAEWIARMQKRTISLHPTLCSTLQYTVQPKTEKL